MNQPSNPVPPFEVIRAVYLLRVNNALKWALAEINHIEHIRRHEKNALSVSFFEKTAVKSINQYKADFLAYAQGKKSFDALAHVVRSQAQSFVEIDALIKQGEGK